MRRQRLKKLMAVFVVVTMIYSFTACKLKEESLIETSRTTSTTVLQKTTEKKTSTAKNIVSSTSTTTVVADQDSVLTKKDFDFGRTVNGYTNFIDLCEAKGGDHWYSFETPSEACKQANRGSNIGDTILEVEKLFPLDDAEMDVSGVTQIDMLTDGVIRHGWTFTLNYNGHTYMKTLFICEGLVGSHCLLDAVVYDID